MGFDENTSVCVTLSFYDALKYFTEMVTPRTFSKIILSKSILSCNSFCVNIFCKNFLLFVSTFGHVAVSKFIEYWHFQILNDSQKDFF